MQEYGGTSSKQGEYRDQSGDGRDKGEYQSYVMQQKNYGCSSKDVSDQNMATYCRVASSIYEATSNQQYQNPRFSNTSAPTFSSPPNSPLVGLVFDPSSPNYGGHGTLGDRSGSDRKPQHWPNQEPIGTGARKKIVKSQDKCNTYNTELRFHDKYKDNIDPDRQKKQDRNLTSESSTSLDFFAEGERMVSQLCNISDPRTDTIQSRTQEEDKNKSSASNSSDLLRSMLDKIVIHDQIPNEIVQLAIEACTDAENIAIAHHNRPCFKNIHSICAKTRSNVQKPDSAVANLHSQGIPWVIKNFIFSFVRILDGWKGVKELLSEKHDTFSRIENKYYSPNIRECFVQWQAVTKDMLTHVYKTFKCLDHGFTMEQKSFSHNYYSTNSAAPRHQNQNKFSSAKSHVTPRPVNLSPQVFNAVQPPWVQSHNQSSSQSFNEIPWPIRPGFGYKKFPVVPPPNSQNFYPLHDQSDYPKTQYKCDPCIIRETKPRQSWTITNVPDFRLLEGMCQAEQRELYNQLKHTMDAELGKAPGQPGLGNMPCDLLQRREMELKSKMIPLSHVEKNLIPSMTTTAADMREYAPKNNSCGDTKEEADFFAAWGQRVQKEPNDFITHHSHGVQIPSNAVVSNISGPVQFIDTENDEFHEISKVYMKPGSYKVPIKPSDPAASFLTGVSTDLSFDNLVSEDINIKAPFAPVTLAPQPKYNMELWPCLVPRSNEEILRDNPESSLARHNIPCLDMRAAADSYDIFGIVTPDRAWEAAKQSAPKLMEFIYEGSKSDAARLYDALRLSTADELPEDLKQIQLDLDQNNAWPLSLTRNNEEDLISNDLTGIWNQCTEKHEYIFKDIGKEVKTRPNSEDKLSETDELGFADDKNDEIKENKKCSNYDHSGNYVRDEKKKPKVTASGMWYHPKKKKPLPINTVKKFENIVSKLTQFTESTFIQHDMDIKVAPRFYEVVRNPMCLHDISTKLKNSSYNEYDQVVHDFRRIFNNVRLYLKSYPDPVMKKNVNKISNEFEKLLSEEFRCKPESKSKSQDHSVSLEINDKKEGKISDKNVDSKNEESTEKAEIKSDGGDKK